MAWKECVICGEKFLFSYKRRKTCSNECSIKLKSFNRKKYNKLYRKKPEKRKIINAQKARAKFKNPTGDVRWQIKCQLGTEPPADLVEEATALRLLNRALRETS